MSQQMLTKRLQTMVTDEEYTLLDAYAHEVRKPLSTLIRETLQQTLLTTIAKRRQQRALDRLCGQDLPVADWGETEREIEQMWEESREQ